MSDVLKFPPPKAEDVQIHVTEGGVNQEFFQGGIVRWSEEPDEQGEGRWIRLHFATGGSINVLTNHPLIYAEPERH